MSSAEGYVLPKPGVPKTLGILNIIFAVLLILFSFCTAAGLLAAPAMMQLAEKTVKDAQAKIDAQQKADQKVFDDRVAAAKTDEEKKQIEAERAASIANKPRLQQVDMTAATDVMGNPTVMATSWAGIITGLILQILLLISGIGLIRLTSWGRSMGIWWGGLQIIQVAALLAVNLLVVMPITRPMSEKQIAAAEEKAKAPGASPIEANAVQMTKTMSSLAVPMAVGQSLCGMIYPVVLLIMLSTAGAKAACLGRKPEGPPDF